MCRTRQNQICNGFGTIRNCATSTPPFVDLKTAGAGDLPVLARRRLGPTPTDYDSRRESEALTEHLRPDQTQADVTSQQNSPTNEDRSRHSEFIFELVFCQDLEFIGLSVHHKNGSIFSREV